MPRACNRPDHCYHPKGLLVTTIIKCSKDDEGHPIEEPYEFKRTTCGVCKCWISDHIITLNEVIKEQVMPEQIRVTFARAGRSISLSKVIEEANLFVAIAKENQSGHFTWGMALHEQMTKLRDMLNFCTK